ncbi:rhomboid family intramembrane serine protease [Tranquillimonas rosea]|uniref:rhomboid family intramembrane serine protease n=1 Tax=Tranquillimonas rosea TaxID=641238 RepID=UPI003BABAF05
MSQPHTAPPFNPMPPVVVALAVVIFGIEAVLSLASRGLLGGAEAIGWRVDLINRFAFSPQIFDRMLESGTWPLDQAMRMVTYPFIHLAFTHVLFVLVFLLALGKMVGEIFHPLALLAVFFGSAAAGALAYALLMNDPNALVGGYPAVYGLIGAYTFLMWTGLGAVGENRLRAFTLIGVLLGLQLVFGLLFGASNWWVAEVAGFVTGFLLSFVVSPGGFGRVMQKLRQR